MTQMAVTTSVLLIRFAVTTPLRWVPHSDAAHGKALQRPVLLRLLRSLQSASGNVAKRNKSQLMAINNSFDAASKIIYHDSIDVAAYTISDLIPYLTERTP